MVDRVIARVRPLVTLALAVDVATLALALAVAENLFKWRSFTLEAIAFLAVWYALRELTRALLRVR